MDSHGSRRVVPRAPADVGDEPLLDFSSGYVQRALPELPRQGSKVPWKLYQSYLRDILLLRYRRVDDGALDFDGGAGG